MYTDSFKDEYIGKYYFEALLDEKRNRVEVEPGTWNPRHFVEILDDHRIKTNFYKYNEHISWFNKEEMIFRIHQGYTYDKNGPPEKVFPVKWLTDDMFVEIGEDYLILIASRAFNNSAGFYAVPFYAYDLLFRKVKSVQ